MILSCRSLLAAIALFYSLCDASERIDGRYSFSLTTFDKSGKLGQVERATLAATLGTPVVTICRSDGIVMACPQGLPSPLIHDDGTSRFCRITNNIACTHSGLGADGRVVLAAAQRLAVEHAFTFDETIPIEIFLEELSLLFQEYTMKPGSRPFGCTVLVAHVPSKDSALDVDAAVPQLYRIDPSGAVESVGPFAIVGSMKASNKLVQTLEAMTETKDDSDAANGVLEQAERTLLETLRTALDEAATINDLTQKKSAKLPFLTASLTQNGRLVVKRHKVDQESGGRERKE